MSGEIWKVRMEPRYSKTPLPKENEYYEVVGEEITFTIASKIEKEIIGSLPKHLRHRYKVTKLLR